MRIILFLFISAIIISFFNVIFLDGILRFLSLDQFSLIILALIILCLSKFDKSIAYKDLQWSFSLDGLKDVTLFTLILIFSTLSVLLIIDDVEFNFKPFASADIFALTLNALLSLFETSLMVLIWVGYIFQKFYRKYNLFGSVFFTALAMSFLSYCSFAIVLFFTALPMNAILETLLALLIHNSADLISTLPLMFLQCYWFLRFKSIWIVIIGTQLIELSGNYFFGFSIENDDVIKMNIRLFIVQDLEVSKAAYGIVWLLLVILYLTINDTPKKKICLNNS